MQTMMICSLYAPHLAFKINLKPSFALHALNGDLFFVRASESV